MSVMESVIWFVSENFIHFRSFSFLMLLFLLGCALCLILTTTRRKRMLRKVPGPKTLPILGNALDINLDHDEMFDALVGEAMLWRWMGDCYRVFVGGQPTVFLYSAETIEPILNSHKHIDKSYEYSFLHPWLGTGLLTSTGRKWHSRRKLLTPAFHFKILEEFVDVFCEHSNVLVDKLSREVGAEKFDIFSYVSLCTLDNVCETVMGRNVQAQEKRDSEYVRAVYKIADVVTSRQYTPWLQPDFLFRFTHYSREQAACLKVLHNFTGKVIQDRREVLKGGRSDEAENEDKCNIYKSHNKNRLAFLDLLIHSSMDGKVLSDQDIREEVDTFMFEGHDTVAAGISWCLYLLGCSPNIQNRVVEELDQILGDSGRNITMKDLTDMKYLECCIKEAQRLYPSVPLFGRELHEDVKVLDYTLPSGTTVVVFSYILHRDPRVFPNPEVYNPENFMPENTKDRHPYAYVPFSAGPRNCIGQRFAMVEEKIVISTMLRKYRVVSVDKRDELALKNELILRPKDGLYIKILPRT